MVKQYEIYWISLDPTLGSEINKTRPGIVITPDSSNKYMNTVIVAPLTSSYRKFPMRMDILLNGQKGQIALDQIRCVDKARLLNKISSLNSTEIREIKELLKQYLVD